MSFTTPRSLYPLASLLALAGACMPLSEDDDDQEFRTTFLCPNCNPNSPAINDFEFPELHLDGLPNSDGVHLVGLVQPMTGMLHRLDTDVHEELIAVSFFTSAVIASGADLLHWRLRLEKDGQYVEGEIVNYDSAVPDWTDLGGRITTYAIAFAEDNLTKNVCPTYFDEPNNPVLTIIRGAAYDRPLAIIDELDDDWVTFACADEGAYKAKLLGYEQARNFAQTGLPATEPQQNATLKMIVADYCGTGHSFTEPGTEMLWQNTAETVTVPVADRGELEALWSEEGAVCIGTPRVHDKLKIAALCPDMPPDCDTIDIPNTPKEWISWLPPSP